MREENQVNSSVDNSNVSDERLDDWDCRNMLHNCLKKLEARVTEMFDVVTLPMRIKLKTL